MFVEFNRANEDYDVEMWYLGEENWWKKREWKSKKGWKIVDVIDSETLSETIISNDIIFQNALVSTT